MAKSTAIAATTRGTILTSEQQQIYNDLVELVSRGAADLYHDACELRNADIRPRAAALLVGHLFREVDSAVRAILTPPSSTSNGAGSGHAKNISAILDVLEVAADDPRIGLWNKFSDKHDPWHLTSFAHRRGLGGIRPFDADFVALCSEFDALLTFLLDRIRASAAKLARKLRDVLAVARPSNDDVSALREKIPNAPFIFDRLFDAQLTPAWIDALLNAGFFREPPPGASVQAAMFARHLSQRDIGRARRILEDLPTVDDAFMANAYMMTMQRLEPDTYAILFNKLLAWAADLPFDQFGSHLYLQFSKLIEHLGACDDASRALAITSALTVVAAPSDDANRFFRDPTSRFDAEQYDQILQAAIVALATRDPLGVINLLCDRLETALAFQFDPPIATPSGNEDISEAWLASFDAPSVSYTLRQVLGRTLSQALGAAVAHDPGCVFMLSQTLKPRRFRIFRRLEAYLYLHGDNVDLADDMVCDRRNFWSIAPSLEFAQLLRQQYSHLTASQKQLVLDDIMADVDPSTVSEDATGDEIRDQSERRTRNYLTLLTGQVPQIYEDALRRLSEVHGLSTDLASQVDGSPHTIGPVSPWSAEQFGRFSPEEIADHLVDRPFDLGPAEQLQYAIVVDPEPFIVALSSFERLEPSYLSYVVLGFSMALQHGRPIDWQATLSFVLRTLARARSSTASTSDWSRLRFEASALLLQGGQGHFQPIDLAARDTALSIIECVLTDEPPNTQVASDFETVLTRSVTDTRTTALRALIAVLFLFRESTPNADLDLRRGVRLQPDCRSLLERFLEKLEQGPVVRFAEGFDSFCRLDRTWTRTIAPRVFSSTDVPDEIGLTAWEAFVSRNPARFVSHDLLAEQYTLAVNQWPIRDSETANPDFGYPVSLATHVIILFVHGRLSLTDHVQPLLARISDNTIGRAMVRFAPHLASHESEMDSEHLNRLMGYWAWRKNTLLADANHHIEELKAFGHWFCTLKFPEPWALNELRTVLELTFGTIHPRHSIVKRLREVTDDGLAGALACVILLIEGRDALGNLFYWAEDIRALLEHASTVSDAHVPAGREIAGRLTAKRIGGFEDIF